MPSERLSDEELLEAAYWNFDARLGRQGYDLARGPQSERDAFKCAVREMLAKLLSCTTGCECWSQPHAGFCPAREG